MVLGWVVDGGEVGRKGIKRRGLGRGLGHWGALRAGWEFLGNFTHGLKGLSTILKLMLSAQTDFTKDQIFMACDEPAVSLTMRSSSQCELTVLGISGRHVTVV